MAQSPTATDRNPQRRGRLKVYLGMAAGVGKTFSMLGDAKSDVARGLDVVIGYLEAHGRRETEELAIGIERLPLREGQYRSVTIREFDLDAALQRRPEVLLVDELAHTNAPGSRHAKRWQDIVELLDAGVSVRTTVNIQHVESLRDVVAQVTGVSVQETVPDSFFDVADEVELVDLPPDELHKRLEEGKVYVPEKVDQAILGFFRRSNLLALRELALRHTAERVDEEMRQIRTLQDVREPWHTRQRILVYVEPNRMAPRVVRAARRLASDLHADLVAVRVESPGQGVSSDAGRAELEAALALAENLGVRTVALAGEDVVAEVIRYAQSENVTTIVVGKAVRRRWLDMVFGSVTDRLIRACGEIDVMVITGAEESGNPLLVRRKPEPSTWQSYAATLGILALCTTIGFLMVRRFDLANIVMVYLLGVAVISVRYGRRESLLGAVLGVALFDVCFVPPHGTFAVTDAQYVVTFGVMLVVSVLISSLTLRLKEQTRSTLKQERETAALYEVSRQLASSRKREEMAAIAARKAALITGAEAVVFAKGDEGRPQVLSPSATGYESDAKELGVVGWVFDHGRPAGTGTDTLSGAVGMYLPLMGSEGCVGVLGLRPPQAQSLDTGRHLVESIAHQLGLALDRTQLAKESHEASLRVEREKLRSSLLSGVSHDLRTPLASIQGSASSLVEQSDLSERSRTLATTVYEESVRMAKLIRDLLDMSRFEGVGVELHLDWHSLEELIGSAILRTENLFETPIHHNVASDLPLLRLDGVLVEQVFVNLLENAARHAGAGTRVEVVAVRGDRGVEVSVRDNGPGIAKGEEEAVFEKFWKRGGTGFGLGLAICRAVMTAHGGNISARNRHEGGAEFKLRFQSEVSHEGW
ncbi:MAG: sensor histidine kinase KdpD [Fimbriimonadaceae bacterium]|nr:sensor histidine kinase KdpD [Fimbriimonadaceae bacterium]